MDLNGTKIALFLIRIFEDLEKKRMKRAKGLFPIILMDFILSVIMKKMKRRLCCLLSLLFLVPPVILTGSAEEPDISKFIIQIQKSLNSKDIPAYLANFSDEIREREETDIQRRFSNFEMDSMSLFKASRLSQVQDEAKINLQALFQNSFSVIIENWSLGLYQTDGRWQIKRKDVVENVSAMYKIKIPAERVERVKSIEIEHVDIKLSFRDALIFYDNIPGIETALLIIGKGHLYFSPSDKGERHQLELIYKKSFLEDELFYAFLRLSPYFFQNNIKILREPEGNNFQVSDVERNKAYSLFARYYPRSFTVENSLNRELYSTLPQGDEAVFDFKGKKYGEFTYIYSPFSEEEIHLFRWKDEKIINLYSPQGKEEGKKLFISFGDMFEVENYQVDIDFDLKQSFISGKARVEVKSRVDSLDRIKLKLNPKLEILRIYDEEMNELFYSRDKLRELVYIYFVRSPSINEPYSIEIFYRGKISPPDQVEDVVSRIQTHDNALKLISIKYETYLFSRRSYWYPSPPDDDYFKARLRIIVPPGYGCVSNGEFISQTKLNGVDRVEEVEKIGSSVYIFEAKSPLKYLSFIVGDFTKVKENFESIPLKLYSSPQIYFPQRGLLEEAKKIIEFYEEKFGPYPYEKLSIVQRLWSTSGGHSPSSFIVLNELPQVAEGGHLVNVGSPVDLSRWREYFIAHEIAHQWWGHGITWRTYHDQWLCEGLAQFAAALYLREKHGEGAFSLILKKFSKWTEKYSKWGPITLGSRISFFNYKAYQSIIYDKTSLALNMLKDLIGEEVFFKGVRDFFKRYEYKAADTRNFIETLEEASGKDLTVFFQNWFYSYVLPEAKVSHSLHKSDEGYILKVKMTQLKEHFIFPLWIEWIENGKKVKRMFIVSKKNEEVDFKLKEKPQRISLNSDKTVPGKFY